MVSIFRENRVDKLLPLAFYQVCEKGLEKIFLGDDVDGEHLSLSPDDIRVAVLGWKSLGNADSQITIDVFATPAQTCVAKHCTSWVTQLESMRWNLLDSGSQSMPFRHRAWSTCRACHIHRAQLEIEGMKRVWEQLPGYFELPSWEDLGKDD